MTVTENYLERKKRAREVFDNNVETFAKRAVFKGCMTSKKSPHVNPYHDAEIYVNDLAQEWARSQDDNNIYFMYQSFEQGDKFYFARMALLFLEDPDMDECSCHVETDDFVTKIQRCILYNIFYDRLDDAIKELCATYNGELIKFEEDQEEVDY